MRLHEDTRRMKIRPDALASRLRGKPESIYLVHGAEPLQREESLDAIRAAARAKGFDERIVLYVESGFDWNALKIQATSRSLFAQKKLIDLRLAGGSPGKEGGQTLTWYAGSPPSDVILLISCDIRLDRRATSTRWFKSLESAGAVIETFPIRTHELPGWIIARGKVKGGAIERGAAEVLAERNEGNLLACAQEIDKLLLLGKGASHEAQANESGDDGAIKHQGSPDGRSVDPEALIVITLDDVMSSVVDSARFGAFDLLDSALEGKGERTMRILRTLRDEGSEPIQILASLTWGIRGVCAVAKRVEGGAGIDEAARSEPGWWAKKRLLDLALRRIPRRGWIRLLGVAEGVDRIMKGSPSRSGAIVRWSRADAWCGLERLVLAMCNVKLRHRQPYS
ncbi:DNA polymerase III subunit delta [Thioalkalivibrio sp. HK1]|uniref:DNA polymerase III subunit delta n=1 Tax=Thioalkalivibrio sp. HK1 TaxID=1469245 RepID=UPI0004707437|nr:DNA polymerase III subunit delta [Thioalkalivibrio sp. HK1]